MTKWRFSVQDKNFNSVKRVEIIYINKVFHPWLKIVHTGLNFSSRNTRPEVIYEKGFLNNSQEINCGRVSFLLQFQTSGLFTTVNILPKLWLIFCCHQQQIQKISHFWHCKNFNSRSKQMTRQMTPFFSTNYWALFVVIFNFCISRYSKFSSIDARLCTMFCFVKYTYTWQRLHFYAFYIDILFSV